jgi:Fic family protein
VHVFLVRYGAIWYYQDKSIGNKVTGMLSFSPTTQLEKALKTLQTDIVLLAEELSTMDEIEKAWLHRSVLISTIGASTRIENAALTFAEIDWVDTTLTQDGKTTAYEAKRTVILNKLSKDRERSVEEVVGCREVLSLVYIQTDDFFPLTESTIRGMHKILLSYYPEAFSYAGSYKPNPNLVVSVNHETGERRVVLEPTAPGPLTDVAMRDLITWYNSVVKEYPWTILVATEFVFRFLAIHPFQDGNGRIGRVLFLLALMQGDDPALKQVVRFISIDRQIERNRPLYYSALRNVSEGLYRPNSKDYKFEPLAWFFLKMIQNALDDVTLLRQRYTALTRLSEGAHRVLACFKSSPEKRLSLSDLVRETGLARRSAQNAILNLVKAGFLQRLGMGPSSRYQLIF